MTFSVLTAPPISQDTARAMVDAFGPLMAAARHEWRGRGGNVGLLLAANPYHLFRNAWPQNMIPDAMKGAAAVLRREIAAGVPVHTAFAEDTENLAQAAGARLATSSDAVEAYLRDLLRLAGLRAAEAWPATRGIDTDPVRDTLEALIVEGSLVPDLDAAALATGEAMAFRDLLARCEGDAGALVLLHDVVRDAVERRAFGRLDENGYERLTAALEASPPAPTPMAA